MRDRERKRVPDERSDVLKGSLSQRERQTDRQRKRDVKRERDRDT